MAQNLGPDQYRIPSLSDVANVPSDLEAMIKSIMKAGSFVVNATDQYARDRYYAADGINTYDAAPGTLVTSPSMETVWLKTGPGISWKTLIGPAQFAEPSQTVQAPSSYSSNNPTWTSGPTLSLPADGVYALFAQARQTVDGADGPRQLRLTLDGDMIAGITQPGVGWWRGSCSRIFICKAGQQVQSAVAHRNVGTTEFMVVTSYTRIR